MARPRSVYRGKRKYGWIITTLLFVLIFAVMAGIWLFYDLQKYIEYERDGLRLVFDREATADIGGTVDDTIIGEAVTNAQIVMKTPDFSDMESLVAGGLEHIKAMYVGEDNVKADTLSYYPDIMSSGGAAYNALVINIKSADGYLRYYSTVPITTSYGVNGTENLKDSLAALKEQGIWLVAEVSCLVDNAMAVRNAPLALRNVTGGIMADESGSWLDPFHPDVRAYMAALMAELAEMGFDEILLTNMSFPKATVQFSQPMSAAPDGLSSVSALAKYLRGEADELGIRLSAVLSGKAMREGASASIGQDAEFFLKVFDRVYVETDIDNYAADTAALAALAKEGPQVVAMVSGFAPTADSFFVR